jgi:hypothetical protein
MCLAVLLSSPSLPALGYHASRLMATALPLSATAAAPRDQGCPAGYVYFHTEFPMTRGHLPIIAALPGLSVYYHDDLASVASRERRSA